MPAFDTSIPITSPPKVLALTDLAGSHVMECYDLETGRFAGYLKAYDPEFFEGRGGVDLTQEIVDALRFKSMGEAFECWKMQSETKPLREDGKPNKPLTAYSISMTRIT